MAAYIISNARSDHQISLFLHKFALSRQNARYYWCPTNARLSYQAGSNSSPSASAFRRNNKRIELDSLSKFSLCCITSSECPSKYIDSQEPVPALTPCIAQSRMVNSFKYLGRLNTTGGGLTKQITPRTAKVRAALGNLWEFWRVHYIHLALRDRA